MRGRSHLIGVDRKGGKGYREVPCEICGFALFISTDSETGICAICVQMGFPKPKAKVSISDIGKAIEHNSLKQYRRKNRIGQDEIARLLDITERHYRRFESGHPISRNIRRKIEKKLAQAEQVQ